MLPASQHKRPGYSKLKHVCVQEKRVLAKFDVDVKEYERNMAEDPGTSQKHPLEKLPRLNRQIVEDREDIAKGPRAIVVHCTHGFNRSGFMICHLLMRKYPSMKVSDCVRAYASRASDLPHGMNSQRARNVTWLEDLCRFQEARPPGMYKDEYIQSLFQYYHEERVASGPQAIDTPLVPSWKPGDDSPEHFVDDDQPKAAAPPGVLALESSVRHQDC
jgi:hypothetical protein